VSIAPENLRARPLSEVKDLLIQRVRERRVPMEFTEPETAKRVVHGLTSLDHAEWAAAFGAPAALHRERAERAEAAGDRDDAAMQWRLAWAYEAVAHYPAPRTPPKRQAYERARGAFRRLAPLLDPPAEPVEIPHSGSAGDGAVLPAYLRRPREAVAPMPLLLIWGGIDTYKERVTLGVEPYLEAGVAVLSFDIPGVGEAPVKGSETAERMWDAVFAWIDRREDLDRQRVGLLGRSAGGYWSTKLVHTHRDRILAAVNHAGMIHHYFTPEAIDRAERSEYPYEHWETMAHAFGVESYEAWLAFAPRLSLLEQGVLDQPCAPLLLVHGTKDTFIPIEDHYLLLEHGQPKSARFFPTAHMGWTPQTEPTIRAWLLGRLTSGR
jgi:esterase FrsA